MKIVFRADASPAIGHGHVMRCLSLARALRDDDADCVFAILPGAGDLRARIERTGFQLMPVADMSATAMGDVLRDVRPDWLIVDHYQLDQVWESSMRPHAKKIMAIDDQPRRSHDCDVLLDQNLIATDALASIDGVSHALVGVEYALLQPDYRELRAQAKPRAGAVRRVLITFGGADRFGLTLLALRTTLAHTGADVAVDVVVTATIADRAEIEAVAARSGRTTVHVDMPTLAPLILAADLGIGAAGSTSWERLCLGLPSIVIALAPNQEPIAAALDQLGLAISIGGIDAAETTLPVAIAKIVSNGLDASWSRRCLAAVDGKGAARVSAVLTATAATPLRARLADPGDEARLLRWANDPVTRRDSFSPRPITSTEHHQWFQRLLNDERTRQFIVQTKSGAEAGQVRFQRHDGEWEVHYAVAPEFRSRGLGTRLLGAALEEFQREHRGRIIGRVKSGNAASQKIFQALGFGVDRADADTLTYARTT